MIMLIGVEPVLGGVNVFYCEFSKPTVSFWEHFKFEDCPVTLVALAGEYINTSFNTIHRSNRFLERGP